MTVTRYLPRSTALCAGACAKALVVTNPRVRNIGSKRISILLRIMKAGRAPIPTRGRHSQRHRQVSNSQAERPTYTFQFPAGAITDSPCDTSDHPRWQNASWGTFRDPGERPAHEGA